VAHCVVFGDIGTSPTTIQTAFNRNDPLPVPIGTDNVWPCVIDLLVDDDHCHADVRHAGDARRQRRRRQMVALITLLRRYGGARGRRTAMTLAVLGLFGATVFFGDSTITPAISPGSDRNSLNRAVRAVLAAGRC
jgi:KUP system potassium uptake protein